MYIGMVSLMSFSYVRKVSHFFKLIRCYLDIGYETDVKLEPLPGLRGFGT